MSIQKKFYKKLLQIATSFLTIKLKTDEMPLASYRLIHKNAILTPNQKEELTNYFLNLELK